MESISAFSVCQLLDGILRNMQGYSGDVNILCIKCLNSWVQFGFDLTEIECFIIHLLNASRIDELNDICYETLASLIIHPNLSRFPTLVNKLVKCILNLEPVLKKASFENDLVSVLNSFRAKRNVCQFSYPYSGLEYFYSHGCRCP